MYLLHPKYQRHSQNRKGQATSGPVNLEEGLNGDKDPERGCQLILSRALGGSLPQTPK